MTAAAIGSVLGQSGKFEHNGDHITARQGSGDAFAVLDQALLRWQDHPSLNMPSLALEGAYMAGSFDAERARELLNRAGPAGVEMQTRLRAQAAVALAEGKCAEAIGLAEAALAVAPLSADPGGKLAEIDWLKELLAECRRTEPKP